METFPYLTCCSLEFKSFRRQSPNNSDQQPMEKVHNMRTTATQKNREVQGVPKHLNRTPKQKVPEEFHERSSSRQSHDQVPRTCHKQTCYDPQLQGFSYGIAIFLMTLGSSIIGSSSYLSSNQVHDVPEHPKNVPRHPKNRTVKDCQQGELQNHDNCENCCIHRPMSPHESNCM